LSTTGRPGTSSELVKRPQSWSGHPARSALEETPATVGPVKLSAELAVRAPPRRRDLADVHAAEEPQPCCGGAAGGAVGAAVGVVASTVYDTGRDAVVTVGRPHRHAANASSPCCAARQLPAPSDVVGAIHTMLRFEGRVVFHLPLVRRLAEAFATRRRRSMIRAVMSTTAAIQTMTIHHTTSPSFVGCAGDNTPPSRS
jgi:hypothetical protein